MYCFLFQDGLEKLTPKSRKRFVQKERQRKKGGSAVTSPAETQVRELLDTKDCKILEGARDFRFSKRIQSSADFGGGMNLHREGN